MKKILISKIAYVSLLLLLVTSCGSLDFGDTLYLEKWQKGVRIHIDRDCKNFGKDSNVEYVKVEEVHGSVQFFVRQVVGFRYGLISEYPFCPKCVSDEDAKRIIELNETQERRVAKGNTVESDTVDYNYYDAY